MKDLERPVPQRGRVAVTGWPGKMLRQRLSDCASNFYFYLIGGHRFIDHRYRVEGIDMFSNFVCYCLKNP